MSVSEMPPRLRERMLPRQWTAAAVGAVMLFDLGCYTYQPMIGARPDVGQQVSLELTDAGRAALGDQLGPGVLEVQGVLQAVQNDQYIVGVNEVKTITGGTAHWGGEKVHIPAADVARSQLRTFSRTRTYLVIGLAVVGVAAFIVTRAINGGGFPGGSDTGQGSTGQTDLKPAR
jgi:hypothetical protein